MVTFPVANIVTVIQFNGWKKDEKTGADGEVSTHSDATQANPTFSREDLGAVLSDAKLRKDSESSKDSGENFIKPQKVSDKDELSQLENGPTVKRYRAMQLIDGKLYPPMSAKVDGEMREPTEIGVWEKVEEHPDLRSRRKRKYLLRLPLKTMRRSIRSLTKPNHRIRHSNVLSATSLLTSRKRAMYPSLPT